MLKTSNVNEFKFEAYGLSIASSVFCSELNTSRADTVDVVVQYGRVPTSLTSPIMKTSYFEINSNEFLVEVSSVAKYYVRDGKTIVIEPLENVTEDQISFYLLGIVFGVLLHQRGLLVLHGSAIAWKDACVVFVAPSGVGKSTLAAAFAQRGFSILTDDVCAIDLNSDHNPYVIPGIPHLKLWDNSVSKLGLSVEQLKKLTPEREKYGLSVRNNFYNKPLRLHHVYQLETSENPHIRVTSLTGAAKFNVLKNNTFKEWLLPGLERQSTHFVDCIKLSTNIPVSVVSRPKLGFQLEQLVDFLLAEFGE